MKGTGAEDMRWDESEGGRRKGFELSDIEADRERVYCIVSFYSRGGTAELIILLIFYCLCEHGHGIFLIRGLDIIVVGIWIGLDVSEGFVSALNSFFTPFLPLEVGL